MLKKEQNLIANNKKKTKYKINIVKIFKVAKPFCLFQRKK